MNRPLIEPAANSPIPEDGAGSLRAATADSIAGESTRLSGPALRDGVVKFPVTRDGIGETLDGALRPRIGQILVTARRINAADVNLVLKFATQSKLRFGEAALRMKLIERRDIELALARQFSLPHVKRGETRVSAAVIAAHAPNDPAVEPFRALRGQIGMSIAEHPRTRATFAVVGATRREGRSFTAANLAVVFAQLGRPTLLLDADLRNPALQRFFGLGNRSGLSTVLSHRSGLECLHGIPGLPSLSVLPAGPTPPNPLDLLESPRFADLLSDLERKFEVVIVDTPAGSEGSDGPLLAQRAGAALVVARERTRSADVRKFARMLERARTHVIGLVFNQRT